MTAPDGAQPLPDISPAEWEVMKAIWDRGPSAARDVFAAVRPSQDWALKTVKTLLSRLVAKGALDYVEVGNSYLYRARYTREQLTSKEVDEFVGRVLDGQPAPALLQLIRGSRLTPADVERLRSVLEEKARHFEKGGA